ncbi:gustatory and odorant receptor 21a-like [Bactrocera neohumeralis]|uniref:gustatory and odorant receptor 21a-like n=1 Tax=Bactrocera tryoni TaxID=59916 RepID=UPI001A968F2C|nr:gustatory and odorant receptor 21a-like [Bactrocera tryoni]XP_050319306.1 gustatory and odorant receptor 21a-like [Bactrocera neohumeralis]
MSFWVKNHDGSTILEKPPRIVPLFNPGQREFLEDEHRHRIQMQKRAQQSGKHTEYYIRKQSTLDDARLLDEHDSFYKTTKSLLVLFQIMGIMPIHRNPPDNNLPRTGFSWKSRQTLYAMCVFSLETFIVAMVLRARVKNFIEQPDKHFDVAIYNIIFISLLFTHFLLPVASWRHGPEVAIFKNMWTNYQYKFWRVTGAPIVFPNLYRLTWGLCIFSWTLSVAVNVSQYFLQPDFEFWYTFAYYPIIAMLNCFCSLWYINCNAFGTVSEALARQLELTLKSDKPAEKLTEFRYLWVDLSLMMQQLGKAYSNMYGMYCLVVFFTTLTAAYGSISEIMDHGATYKEIGLFVIMFYCMSLLYIICNEAHQASRKVGLDFQTKLLNVNLIALDTASQREVQMFLLAIAKTPPIMNLDDYANINRELFSSNLTFMATYLVVLLQFKITEQRGLRENQSEPSMDYGE